MSAVARFQEHFHDVTVFSFLYWNRNICQFQVAFLKSMLPDLCRAYIIICLLSYVRHVVRTLAMYNYKSQQVCILNFGVTLY